MGWFSSFLCRKTLTGEGSCSTLLTSSSTIPLWSCSKGSTHIPCWFLDHFTECDDDIPLSHRSFQLWPWTLNSFLLLKKLCRDKKFSCLARVFPLNKISWQTLWLHRSSTNWGFSGDCREYFDHFLVSDSILGVLGLSPWYFYSCLKLPSLLWTLSSPSMSLLPGGAQNCPQDLGGSLSCFPIPFQREFQAGILQLFEVVRVVLKSSKSEMC